MFGLPESVVSIQSTTPPDLLFLKKTNLFLGNARSGIFILVDLLKPANVWMPSYLCPTMLEAVDKSVTKLKFYKVDFDLQISSLNWIKQIQTGDLVILIDYFGFPLSSKIGGMVKKQGGYILEDACQALLSKHVGQHSDFVLFSPRKFIGIPDGGILVSCCNIKFDTIKLKPIPVSWWLKMLEATINRREFDQFGGKLNWYRLFQECESTMPHGYFSMSNFSYQLLFNSFNYKQIAKQRIENYSVLLNEIRFKHMAIFDSLPEDTVPLGFAIRHINRDFVLQKLFKEQIYPPVHWPIESLIPKEFGESHLLANQIMTLPCDQRYSPESIYRLISCFQKATGR